MIVTTSHNSTGEPRCLGCNYRLDGLTLPRCPECGRAFDPNDPRTWRRDRWDPERVKFFTTPPGWILHSITALAAVTSLLAFTVPGGFIPVAIVAFFGWLLIGAVWTIRGLVAFGTLAVWGIPQFKHQRSGWHWLVAPGLVGLTFALVAVDIPFRLTFWLSKPGLDRYVQRIVMEPGEHKDCPSGWFLTGFERARTKEGRVYLDISKAGFWETFTLVYSPAGPLPTDSAEQSCTQLDGHWYLWWEMY